jgi:hypothetical protein
MDRRFFCPGHHYHQNFRRDQQIQDAFEGVTGFAPDKGGTDHEMDRRFSDSAFSRHGPGPVLPK